MEKGTPYREQHEDKADKAKEEAAARANKAPRPPGLHHTPQSKATCVSKKKRHKAYSTWRLWFVRIPKSS